MIFAHSAASIAPSLQAERESEGEVSPRGTTRAQWSNFSLDSTLRIVDFINNSWLNGMPETLMIAQHGASSQASPPPPFPKEELKEDFVFGGLLRLAELLVVKSRELASSQLPEFANSSGLQNGRPTGPKDGRKEADHASVDITACHPTIALFKGNIEKGLGILRARFDH